MNTPKIHKTDEEKLNEIVDEYTRAHKIPWQGRGSTNGVNVTGWGHIPDRILGKEEDDVCSKCVVIEIKPKKEQALKDLQKPEYNSVKHKACFYFDNQGDVVGTYISVNDVIELPFNKLVDHLYNNIYLPSNNPLVAQCVNHYFELTKSYTREEIFNVMASSFTNTPIQFDLHYSIKEFKEKYCDLITNTEDKLTVFNNIVFGNTSEQIKTTRDKRHKLGQYITEYPHTIEVAKKVVEIFSRDENLIIDERCVGTAAIAVEVVKMLYAKYNKTKAYKIMKYQLKFADIDASMRSIARVALFLQTEKLFGKGKGILFDIEKSDLEHDKIDLSNRIVYGNLPFNKGKAHLYLPRILNQLENCEMRYGVFIVSSQSINPTKGPAKKILGNAFYEKIEDFREKDFKTYNIATRFIEYDKSKKSSPTRILSSNFVLLKNLANIELLASFMSKGGNRFKDKTLLYSKEYDHKYSIPLLRQTDLHTNEIVCRVPSPNAPMGTKERELYERYAVEKGKYVIPTSSTFLAVGYTTPRGTPPVKFYTNLSCFGTYLFQIFGNEKLLGVVGVILQSLVFKTKLSKGWIVMKDTPNVQLSKSRLKELPIPKNIPQRLYDIGQQLIIEGKEDEELRKEADKIIEELYKDLEI